MRTLSLFLALIASPLFAAGWGTLTAAFEYDGKPPVLEPIDVRGKADKAPPNDSFTIGPKNELANVVLYLPTQKGKDVPWHRDVAKAIPDTVTVNIEERRFEPKIAVVAPTRLLRFVNHDPVAVIPVLYVMKNAPGCDALSANGTADFHVRLAEPVPARIGCTIHPWMSAYLIANSNPYVAVSDTAGRIKLEHVPAGEWEFVLWHGELVKRARIDGVDTELVRGRIKVTIEDGKTTDLGVVRFVARPL